MSNIYDTVAAKLGWRYTEAYSGFIHPEYMTESGYLVRKTAKDVCNGSGIDSADAAHEWNDNHEAEAERKRQRVRNVEDME